MWNASPLLFGHNCATTGLRCELREHWIVRAALCVFQAHRQRSHSGWQKYGTVQSADAGGSAARASGRHRVIDTIFPAFCHLNTSTLTVEIDVIFCQNHLLPAFGSRHLIFNNQWFLVLFTCSTSSAKNGSACEQWRLTCACSLQTISRSSPTRPLTPR